MTLFRFLPAFAFVVLVTISTIPVANADEAIAATPNVVVFLVDDLGYMDIGANNPNCFYETPNIDGLSESGMRFTDGYAANPVCSPTRFSLMTGKYPTRARATNFFSGKRSGKFHPAPLNSNMPLDEITIAEALKSKGYATFFAGKWHLGEDESHYPQNQGFDVNIGGHAKGGPYTGKKYFAPFENPQMEIESPDGDHLPDRLARDTADFIDQNKGKPFLAYLSFYSVHTPLMGRPDLVEKYKKKAAAITGKEFDDEEQVIGDQPRKVRVLQKHAVYAAMVEAMDQAVGKVLRQLEDSGVADDTIVVFTSDNGGLATSEGSPTSNLPLRGGKGWVYEGGIREPWIVRYPGVTQAGSTSNTPICSIDLFPTIASAASIEVQHLIDGVDLRPALAGGTLDRDALFWHYPHYSNQGGIPGGAIRQGKYKLFERYEDGRVHLYDLESDIGESNDLADKMPKRVDQMRNRLHAWYKSVDAQFLQPKDGNVPWSPVKDTQAGLTKTESTALVAGSENALRRQPIAEIAEPTKVDSAKPNFVVFVADDMGWGDSATYGHELIQTPNLDKLASQGVKFTQCYSACGVCSPSRSAILTGRTPYRNGVWRHLSGIHEAHLRASEITYPELLKEAGYETCHVGKWHLNSKQHFNDPDYPQPGDHGYDHWMITHNNAEPSHKNPDNFVRNGEPVGKLEGYSAQLVAAEATRWLEEVRDSSKPFSMTVWVHEPHSPIATDPRFESLYEGNENSKYMGNITQMDHALGMVMDTLDAQALAENTFLFFTSDNGPVAAFGGTTGGLRGGKRSDHEGGIRVPGIARWPARIAAGTTSDVPVIGTDLFSTVLDIVGIARPTDRTIDGVSMVPAFTGKALKRDVPLFWRTHVSPAGDRVAMRMGDWKIVGNDTMTKFQLFDIQTDWKEENDLAQNEPAKMAQMKETLFQVWKNIESEGPSQWWLNDGQKPVKGSKLNY